MPTLTLRLGFSILTTRFTLTTATFLRRSTAAWGASSQTSWTCRLTRRVVAKAVALGERFRVILEDRRG